METKGYVYCLKNPLKENIVFYVGQTTMPIAERLQNHIRESRFRKNSKGLVILSIVAEDKKPIIEILEEVNGGSYAEVVKKLSKREKYWIQKFEGLCNKYHVGFDIICDNCGTPFTAKRQRAKFCSDICRASFHQSILEKPKKVKEMSVQEMYTGILEMIKTIPELINSKPIELPADYLNFDKVGIMRGDGSVEPLDFSAPQIALKSFEQWKREKHECENEEDWERIKSGIMAATNLTSKQKDLLIKYS